MNGFDAINEPECIPAAVAVAALWQVCGDVTRASSCHVLISSRMIAAPVLSPRHQKKCKNDESTAEYR
jgi:hypothetical protein